MVASGMLSRPLHQRSGRPTIPGIPWHFRNRIAEIDRAAPLLGQHTKEIARELGIDEEALSMLLREQLLFTPQE
jgi:crotonobetainyl-CoA:carnitine CoA-transferase CaiB-like acyl-CoA transferase